MLTLISSLTLLSITKLAADAGQALTAAPDALSPKLVELLKHRMALNSSDTWVSGARIQALLEYDYPGLSVFSEEYTEVFKTHKPVPRSTNAIVASWQAVHNSTDGQFITSPGNSPTDAMSVGIGFVLAYLTNADAGKRAKYAASVEQAVDYIWTGIPRDSKGAISTRPATEPIQYWADELYMLPPFMAYYGVYSHNVSMIREAFRQIKLYRQILLDPKHHALRHIEGGNWQETSLWATGNAWSANGMARVAATILNSKYQTVLLKEAAQLIMWSNEIVQTAFSQLNTTSNLLPNQYFPANGTFNDASSSALLTSTVYRLASFGLKSAQHLLPEAARVRRQLYKSIDPKTGWVKETTDPFKGFEQGNSPESVSFVLGMEAAWRDWKADRGTNKYGLLKAELVVSLRLFTQTLLA